MDTDRIITSLNAAKECVDAAMKNVKKNEPYSCAIAIDNAIECLKSARAKCK